MGDGCCYDFGVVVVVESFDSVFDFVVEVFLVLMESLYSVLFWILFSRV